MREAVEQASPHTVHRLVPLVLTLEKRYLSLPCPMPVETFMCVYVFHVCFSKPACSAEAILAPVHNLLIIGIERRRQ